MSISIFLLGAVIFIFLAKNSKEEHSLHYLLIPLWIRVVGRIGAGLVGGSLFLIAYVLIT